MALDDCPVLQYFVGNLHCTYFQGIGEFLRSPLGGIGSQQILMKDRTSRTLISLIVGCLFTAFAQQAFAQAIEKVHFPKSAGHLLLSYSVRHEMLADNDPQPLLQIYGNGRVVVHRPDYMKGGGDFEMSLSQKELQTLCRELIVKKIMSYREQNAINEVRRLALESGAQYSVSDTSNVEINFNPRGVALANSNSIEPVGSRRHKLKNVRARAELYSNTVMFKDMADIEAKLMGFVYSPKLVSVQ